MNLRDLLPTVRATDTVARASGRDVYLPDIFKAIYLAALYDGHPKSMIVVTPGAEEADTLATEMAAFLGDDILVMPQRGTDSETVAPDPESAGVRAKALDRLLNTPSAIIVTDAAAAAEELSAPRQGGRLAVTLNVGRECDLGSLIETLTGYGYERVYEVQNRAEFSVRGGIVDIFGPSMAQPVRLEFDGDEVASIRVFSLVDQLSTGLIEETVVYPARDLAGGGASIFDYLPEGGLVVLDEPAAFPTGLDGLAIPGGALTISSLSPDESAITVIRHPVFHREGHGADFDLIKQHIEDLIKRDIKVFAVFEDRDRLARFEYMLKEWRLKKGVETGAGALRSGFVFPDAKIAIITEADMFGLKRELRQTRQTKARAFFDLMDLREGDYVVHVYHGIGRYAGLTQKTVDGIRRDYLLIVYAQGDKLYIPTDQMGLIQRYIGGEGIAPRVDRLGSNRWHRVKRKVKASAAKLAAELVELYAARKEADGFAFPPDTPWQSYLEESFPFVETADQETAIAEVKADMEQPHPMDRLICGDVGYGKTEVAVRAAFKSIMGGKQVAVLVPTTLLAEQHYATFSERFEAFPIRLEHLSRLRPRSEQAEVIQDLTLGSVDAVIGTHRLLQKDVSFKNLGLFIIDEEQRFGVRHKEFLKNLRLNVDVLTLSATPIPRTLNMALTGARDMSVIDTPPEDRFPVVTFVKEYDEAQVSVAIERELNRGGQAFFVHNRVDSIGYVADNIRRLVPAARVAVSHGQMSERTLERVMLDFGARRYDVLVSTTIIESGLDMPNVNTLIVDRADKLGLSQLYQLRGRVGRSDRRAYAIFMYPTGTPLTSTQLRRLKTIAEFTDLGSGFRVALRDLEIRGAGNVLGAEQHGFVNEVGFELYAELLSEAVAKLRGEPVRKHTEVRISLPLEAHIPEEYIGEEPLRIDAYKKIALAGDDAAIDRLHDEFIDRFGEPPEPVKNLLLIAGLKHAAASLGANRISSEKGVSAGRPDRIRISPIDSSPGLKLGLKRWEADVVYKERERALYVKAPAAAIGVFLVRQVLYDIIAGVSSAEVVKEETNEH